MEPTTVLTALAFILVPSTISLLVLYLSERAHAKRNVQAAKGWKQVAEQRGSDLYVTRQSLAEMTAEIGSRIHMDRFHRAIDRATADKAKAENERLRLGLELTKAETRILEQDREIARLKGELVSALAHGRQLEGWIRNDYAAGLSPDGRKLPTHLLS